MSRRHVPVGVFAALTVGLFGLLGSGVSSAAVQRTAAVVPNAAVADSVPAPVSSGTAVKVGSYNQAATLHVNVALSVRNSAELNRLIAARERLTSAQYAAYYAPTAGEAAALSSWLKGAGLTVLGTAPANLWVKAQGSTQQVERAFGVSLDSYRANGRVFFSNSQAPLVPARLDVSGITGLSNYLVPTITLKAAMTYGAAAGHVTPSVAAPYCPATFTKAYDVTHNASGQTIGMVLYGAAMTQTDLTNFTNTCGGSLTIGTGADQVQFLNVDGTSTDTSPWPETALDVENGHGIAPGAHIKYYLADLQGSGTAIEDAELAAVSDPSLSVISNSWSECSDTSVPCDVNSDTNQDRPLDAALQMAASIGKTVYFASGDNPVKLYPATSPYVVAVGGTTLNVQSDGSWSSETTWSDTGTGCSSIWPQPSWQNGVSGLTCAGRAEPDISADADPNTPAWDCFSGSCEAVGGTSLAAPLWAGMTADWNAARAAESQPGVGFDAPLLYQIGQNTTPYCPAQTFHDSITSSPKSTIENWPGGTATFGTGSCTVTVARPSGAIDLIGGTAGVDSWKIAASEGFGGASISVANPTCLGFASGGSVKVNRPTCSNASTVGETGHSAATATITTTAGGHPFHDITSGCSGGVCAATGWDPATGWGSPDFNILLADTPLAQTITFASIPTHTLGDPAFSITPTASSGLAVAVTSTTTGVCTVQNLPPPSGLTVVMAHAGTCSLTATQPGNLSFLPATPVTQSFTVNQETQTITFGAISAKQVTSAPFTIGPTATSGLAVSVASNTTAICTISGTTVSVVNPGTCSLTASQAGNGDYRSAAPVTQTFDVSTPNVVKDGGFENPPQTTGHFVDITAGHSVGPWHVTAGSVDLTNTVWQNAAGTQSLDLAGLAPGTITQTFTLGWTGTYKVHFEYAGNPEGPPTVKHMTVTANAPGWGSPVSLSKTFKITGHSDASMGWKSGQLTFAGTVGDAVTLTFADTDSSTPYGMTLDAITTIAH